ncbi:MAG: hypothetical protein M1832_000626 [Thelocarpon impressellum]|nr:MAG: hypothetical protein M1832_000626 [Thelocarpon impressellum]
MPAIAADDPLWVVRRLPPPLADDDPLLRRAHRLIDHGPAETVAPELLERAREQLHRLLALSPHQAAAATFVSRALDGGGPVQLQPKVRDACVFFTQGTWPTPAPTPAPGGSTPSSTSSRRAAQVAAGAAAPSPTRRSSTFSRWVRANGFCRVTGQRGELHACHILPHLHRNQEPGFLDLLTALFGPDAVDALLRNLLNAGDVTREGIDRHDNCIALRPSLHTDWDRTHFFLEFVCRFRSDEPPSFSNFWIPPLIQPDGRTTFAALEDGDEIPIRRAEPVNGRELPMPSPFLLYVREVVGRVAHMMGAAEWQDPEDSESDHWEEPVAAATVVAQALLPPRGPAKDGGVSEWLESLGADDDGASSSAASWPGDVVIASG